MEYAAENFFQSVPGLTDCRGIRVGALRIGGPAPLCLIAGPCVIESREHVFEMAEQLTGLARKLDVPFIFKASFDKANRTSAGSYRGPGLEKGLQMLAEIRAKFNVPITSDVHTEEQAAVAGEVLDMLQVPAFLCRQTDFIVAAGKSGKAVNVKKGQFLAPWDVSNIVKKLQACGCEDVLLTERGASFGYGALVSDMRALSIMREKTGMPVCFDATHSVQQPGGLGETSGGQRQYVPLLARAACAAGINALFMETHDQPEKALSDGPNMVPLAHLEPVLRGCLAADKAVRTWHDGA